MRHYCERAGATWAICAFTSSCGTSTRHMFVDANVKICDRVMCDRFAVEYLLITGKFGKRKSLVDPDSLFFNDMLSTEFPYSLFCYT